MAGTLEFQFRRRYSLPPADPRFLSATRAEMLVDYWAHQHADDPNVREPDVTEDFEDELAAFEREQEEAEAAAAARAAQHASDEGWEVADKVDFGSAK